MKNVPSDPFADLPDASVELYSYSNQIRPSVHYTVEVAGGKATVIPTKEHQVCAFGCDDPVAVKVTYNADFIDKAEILPKSKDWRYVTSREAVTVGTAPAPTNNAKIAEIKEAIAQGRFKINPEAIADRLLDTAREMISKHRQA